MFKFAQDIELLQDLLQLSRRDLAAELGISPATLNRWAEEKATPSSANLELLYSFAYKRGVRFNNVKAQLFMEDYATAASPVLFHGSKSGIEGPLSLSASRANNDFGRGFYCGESFRQSAMFVSRFPQSSVYAVAFNALGLHSETFEVNERWMLAVAYHRGKLQEYAEHPLLKTLSKDIERADYIVAPIADNRMFETIDSFIEGEITTEQCRHCLSATNLGRQYVFRTSKALERVSLLEQCYVCAPERSDYLAHAVDESRAGNEKVKVARRQYRGEGKYIEELFA